MVPKVLSSSNILLFSNSRTETQGYKQRVLSINTKYLDHSLNFQGSTSNSSADGGILMMQETVLHFSCDCFVRMPSRKEVWRSSGWLCWTFLCDVRDWDQVNAFVGWELVPALRPCRASEDCPWHSHLMLAPRTLWPNHSPVPLFPEPPFWPENCLVCWPFARCTMHRCVFWSPSPWPQLRDLWESPPQLQACLPFP